MGLCIIKVIFFNAYVLNQSNLHHIGSITHLFFPSRSHLISSSEDGTLCLFHARDWTVLRVLRGHKARVNSVAVHPSGKVALSVGKDKTLRMWDLMRGKGVASTKFETGTESALFLSSNNNKKNSYSYRRGDCPVVNRRNEIRRPVRF